MALGLLWVCITILQFVLLYGIYRNKDRILEELVQSGDFSQSEGVAFKVFKSFQLSNSCSYQGAGDKGKVQRPGLDKALNAELWFCSGFKPERFTGYV